MAVTSSRRAVVTLPEDTQILITREFDAPARLVYRAWTEPELVRRWWSGDRGEVTSAEIDLRVGGTWRYVMTANAGFEVAFHGEYRELVPAGNSLRSARHPSFFEGPPWTFCSSRAAPFPDRSINSFSSSRGGGWRCMRTGHRQICARVSTGSVR